MKIRKLVLRRLARFPLAALIVAGVTQAAQVTWDSNTGVAGAQDGGGTWNTALNTWWNGSSNVLWPNTTNDEAIFGASSGTTGAVTVSGTVNLNKLTFNPTGGGVYQVNGGILNFGGVSPTVSSVASGFIGASIAGSGGLTKTGNGFLVLYGASTYTGNTNIDAGSLYLGGGFTTGSLSPASPIINNAALYFQRSDTITQGTDFGVISGSGSVTKIIGGTTILSSANSYAGGTFVNAGTIKLGSATGIPAGGGVTVATGAVFDTVGSYANGAVPIGTVTLNGGSMTNSAFGGADYYLNKLVMTGGTVNQSLTNNFYYRFIGTGAGITVNASSTTSQLIGVTTGAHLILNSNGTALPINVASGTTATGIDLDVSTRLSSSSGFSKTGAGTMRLSHISNTTPILVSEGRLRVDSIASGSSGPFGSGIITIDGGIVSYGGASSTSTNKGFTLGTTAGGGIEVSDAAATLTITGGLSGTGGVLVKSGPGTLALTSASHTGATTISAGKLMLSNAGNEFASGVSVPPGSVFELNSTASLNTFDVMQLNGSPITGSGTITKTGPGIVQYQNTTVLADFAGTVDIQAGTFGSSQTSGTLGKADSLMAVNVGPSGLFDMRVSGVNGARIDKLTGTGRVGNTWPGVAVLTVGTGNGSSTFAGQIQGNSTNGSADDTTNPNTGTVELVKTGTGTLTLSGTNSYSGLTSVNQGTLFAGSNTALGTGDGTAATGTVVANGAALELAAGVTIGTGESLTIAGSGIPTQGYGALSQTPFASGALAYNGAISLSASAAIGTRGGVLTLNGPIAMADSILTLQSQGGTINVNGAINGNTSGFNDTVYIRNGGTVSLNAANSYLGPTAIFSANILNANVLNALPTLNGRTTMTLSHASAVLNIGGSGGFPQGSSQTVASLTGIANSQVTLGSNTLTIGFGSGLNTNGTTNANFPGIISGTGGITKDQGSTQILSGSNTYSGLTTISGGVLQIGNNDASTNLGNSSFTVASGAQLVFSRNVEGTSFSNQSIGGSGEVVFTGQSTGYFTLQGGYTGALTYSGKTTVNFDAATGSTVAYQRALWLEKDNVFSNASLLDLQSGKVYLRNQTGQGVKMAGLTGVAGTLLTTDQTLIQKVTINASSGSYTYAGIIGKDPGYASSTAKVSLTKTGTGTQTLTGANTYTDGTTVSGGTLIASETIAANVSATGVGPVTVNGTGTLGGGNAAATTGSVRGNLAVASGGSVSPGVGGTGILTVNGNTSFASGSSLQIQINGTSAGTTYDQLKVNGTVNLGGATLVRSGSFVPLAGQSFVIVNNDGSDPVSGAFYGLPEGSPVSINGATLYITYIGGDGNDVVIHPPLVATNFADSGAGSLRQTIISANPGDAIIFDASLSGKTITLTSGELLINKTLSIDASALTKGLTISGNGSSRAFNISGGNAVNLIGLTITGGNSAGNGGGITNSGNLVLSRCILSGNKSGAWGGAIYVSSGGTLDSENSTMAGNHAFIGGGMFVDGSATLIHNTITANKATNGGGVWASPSVAIHNTIIAGNASNDSADVGNSVTQTGVNLIGGDPRLAPLSDYGGPTQTMPPLVGSPVIDAGGATGLLIDQRGFPRNVDGAPVAGAVPDIGAVEAGPVTLVTNANDSGTGSLRDALANATAPGARILFNLPSSSVITLNGAELSVAGSRTIFMDASSLVTGTGVVAMEPDPVRPGSNLIPRGVTVSGGNASRVFSIASSGNVAMHRLTVTDGSSTGTGGGILNNGTLTLVESAISNCTTTYRGGGIFNFGVGALIRSAVHDNHADNIGGGIMNEVGTLSLANSTVAGNTSSSQGGGIFSFSKITLTNSTISKNTASQGGGILTQDGNIQLSNTILAGNTASSFNPDLVKVGSDIITSSGGNLLGTEQFLTGIFPAGSPNANGDLVGTSAAPIDPMLASLADNGGATKTMAFVGNSPAIDAGVSTGLAPFTDQRGYSRMVAGGLDIGAFESGAGNFSQTGLTLYATVPSAQTLSAADVEFQISTDKDFLPTISTLAGTGSIGSTDGAKLSAMFSYSSGVAQDAQGNIFTADTGNNRIRMLSPAGVVSTIAGTGVFGFADGPGPSALFKFPAGITIAPNGDLFVADTLNHRIRKLARPAIAGLPWTVTTLAGTGSSGFFEGAGSVARFNHPHGLVVDETTGNIFVADAFNHRIRMVTPAGVVSTYAGSGGLGSANSARLTSSFNVPFGVAMDSGGNLFVADRDNHRIRKVTPSAVSTFAGNGSSGFLNSETGANATFNTPAAIAIDEDDILYVSDQNNHAIRKVAPDGVVTTVAGRGAIAGPGDEDGNSIYARFKYPAGLTVDLKNNLIVADTENHRLRHIIVKPLSVVATKGSATAFGVPFSGVIDAAELGLDPNVQYYFRWHSLLDDSTQMLGQSFSMIPLPSVVTEVADNLTPTSARLNATVNPLGNSANVVFEYSSDPALLSPAPVTVSAGSLSGSTPLAASATIPQPATPGAMVYFRAVATNARGVTRGEILSFSYPIPSVVTVAADNLTRTAARLNATVDPMGSPLTVKFQYSTDPDLGGPLKVTTLAGTGVAGSVNGAGAGASFANPRGVAIFGTDSYVADRLNHRIRKITSSGVVSTFAGSTAGFDNTGSGKFDHPSGVAADVSGNIYVADEYNHVIRKITSGGVVSTFAGTGVAGFVDGASGAARFFYPTGVAVDASGNVYVADSGNHRIRMIAAAGGAVTTVAGTGVAGSTDGAVGTAQFNAPLAVAVGSAAKVFVADTGNHRIRLIDGGNVSTRAGSGADGFLDGAGGTASFSSPAGIAVDGAGVAYVADRGGHRIRRVASNGQVSTLAGSGVAGMLNSPLTGLYPATASRFNLPSGIAIDGTGNLFVTQEGNPALRKIARGTLPEVTVTPSSVGSGARLVSTTITPPLLAGATYYARATGTNVLGTVQGDIISFTVPTEPAIAVFSGAEPLAHAQTTAVDFGTTPAGVSFTRQFSISNTGGWSLGGIAITVPAGYGFSGGIGPVEPGGSVTFSVNLTAATAGTFAGNVNIASDDPVRGVFTFPITGTVLDPPVVTTLAATDVVPTGATLNATINPKGGNATAWFEYSEDPELDGVIVSTAAGAETGFLNGAVLAAKFNQPNGLATDAAGNTYVADTLNHRIRKITAGGSVSTVAGTGVAGFANGAGTTAQFNEPTGVVLGAGGILYVTDSKNHRIRAISPAGVVSTFSGSGEQGFTEGVSGGTRFNTPLGLAIGPAGTSFVLYVADSLNQRVRKVADDGSVTTLAVLNTPAGIAVNSNSGVVYVTETGRHAIQRIQPGGAVDVFAGAVGTPAFSNATGTAARFSSPVGLAVDSTGRIYVADKGNNRIRRITSDGIVTTVAGLGIQGATDGAGEVAKFDIPTSLAIDATGAVLVGELANSRIRSIVPGIIVVQAATGLNGIVPLAVSTPITGLVDGKTYYFRALATNGGGTTFGSIFSIGGLPAPPFVSWQGIHFGVDYENPLIAGWNADPSKDGVVNLLKYAFGLDPNISSQVGLPVLSVSGGQLRLTYSKVLVATDLSYVPEWSTNLVDWSPLGVTEEILSTNAGIQQTRASVPISGASTKYLRLRVTFLQP